MMFLRKWGKKENNLLTQLLEVWGMRGSKFVWNNLKPDGWILLTDSYVTRRYNIQLSIVNFGVTNSNTNTVPSQTCMVL